MCDRLIWGRGLGWGGYIAKYFLTSKYNNSVLILCREFRFQTLEKNNSNAIGFFFLISLHYNAYTYTLYYTRILLACVYIYINISIKLS